MTNYEPEKTPAALATAITPGEVDAVAALDGLALIPPARLELVQQRIEVIEAYLALNPPTARDATEGADRLGIALSTFYALVRSWRGRGRPTDVVGSGYRAGPSRPRIIGDEAFIERALKTLPMGPTVESDVVALVRLAAEQGIKLRAISSLRRKVRELRPERQETIEADLLLGRAALELPIETEDGTILPVACILVDDRSRRILGVRLSLDPEGNRAAAGVLLDALIARRLVDPIPGTESAATSLAWGAGVFEDQAVSDVLGSHGIQMMDARPVVRTRINFHVARLLDTINLKGLPRVGGWERTKRVTEAKGRLNAPVSLEKAQAMIDARLVGESPTVLGTRGIDGVVSLAFSLRRFTDHE